MSALLPLIKKEFIQLRRDPRMMFIVMVVPVVQLILLGYAASLDVSSLKTVFCDFDQSASSRQLIDSFINSTYFTPVTYVSRMDEVDDLIEYGKASVAIIIPHGFGRDIGSGRKPDLLIIIDGSESQPAIIGINAAAAISRRFFERLSLEVLERLPGSGLSPVIINPEIRVWYNPALRSRNFFVPGVLVLVLMIMTMLLSSMAIVREKELGTMEQLIVTPIKPFELVLGKLLPFVIVGLSDALLVITVAVSVLKVPFRGSLLTMFVMSLCFILSTLGLGLFISTIARTQQQAMLTAVFFVFPMILLGGFIFPIENMPVIFQKLTYIIPVRYFIVIVRSIFLKGAGWPELLDETLALIAIGSAILGLSMLRFRKRLD